MKTSMTIRIFFILLPLCFLVSCGKEDPVPVRHFTTGEVENILPGTWSDEAGSIRFSRHGNTFSVDMQKSLRPGAELELHGTYEVITADKIFLTYDRMRFKGGRVRGHGPVRAQLITTIQVLSEDSMFASIKDRKGALFESTLMKQAPLTNYRNPPS